MYRKGVYRGNDNVNSVLTEAQVRVIKQHLMVGQSAASLARIYRVSAETIRRIARGETWGYVDVEEAKVLPLVIPPATEQEKVEIAASLAKFMKLQEGGK